MSGKYIVFSNFLLKFPGRRWGHTTKVQFGKRTNFPDRYIIAMSMYTISAAKSL